MSVPPDSNRGRRTAAREEIGGRSSLGAETGLGLDAGWQRWLGCHVPSAYLRKPLRANRTSGAWALAAVVAVIAWFYAWTVDPEGNQPALTSGGQGYYNLLARGFLKGQTALDVEVDPALTRLKDPYDVKQRAGLGLHDASYYRGRYFIYFGVTPAVAAFVPAKVLTGKLMEERWAIVGFAVAGFIVSVLLLADVARRSLAGSPGWVVIAGAITLGLATMVPALLRRPSIWEVPIAAGYAGFMLTLFCTWRALRATRGAWIWLAIASAAMGLTVGARPTYLPAAVVLLAPLALRLRPWLSREWRGLAVAALGPVMVAGAGLAAYNYLRFGSVTEFGQTYQMAGDDIRELKLFSLDYMAYNFRVYVLAAAGLSPFFPFVTVIDVPPGPPGHLGIEDAYGLLPSVPWVVLALAAQLGSGSGPKGRYLRFWVGGTALAGGATAVFVFGFAGACGRYMVDFAPTIVLLAGVGALAWSGRARGFGRVVATGVIGALALWSAAFGVLSSLQHNALLQAEHPAVYRRLAHAGNRPGHLLDIWQGKEYGPVELEAIFPLGATGRVEPLLATGRTFRSDYLFVHYLADDLVRFGYEHTALGGATGEPVRIVPGAVQKLLVEMGPLYPPAAHPYFDAMPPGQARRRQRTVRVTMNGKVAFHRSAELFDAVARRPDVGTAAGRGAFKQPFSGKILGQRIVPAAAQAVEADVFGPVVITVTLPPFAGVRSEPLVSSGETGKGDVVYIKYLDAQTVVFGYDHWGYGGFESDAAAVKPGEELVIAVDYGALYAEGTAPRDRVVVRLNGRIVADRAAKFHPCTPDTVVVGANMIGASTAAAVFSGNIIKQQRTAP